MKAYDFEYDGIRLSDYGFVICKFGGNGLTTISNGSVISFNTVPTMQGAKHEFVSSEYKECITATFQICKSSCASQEIEEISIGEVRNIMNWLNRKSYHKFKLLTEDYVNIYFEATFNVSRIEINGRICGFELSMTTNRPHALHEPITITLDFTKELEKTVFVKSDDEGYIYPEMEITPRRLSSYYN